LRSSPSRSSLRHACQTLSWFGNPAVFLSQETRGFAASPRSECASSSDLVWSDIP